MTTIADFSSARTGADGLQFDPNERRIFPIIFDGEYAKPAEFYDHYVEFCHSEQGLADIALFLSENHSANIQHRAPAGDMSKIQAALLPEWATELMSKLRFLSQSGRHSKSRNERDCYAIIRARYKPKTSQSDVTQT